MNNTNTTKSQVTTVSKSTADAVKSNAVNTPIYSHERNKKIDDKVRSYATSRRDLRETNKNLDIMYKELGTFGTTAEMQQYIDQQAIREAVRKFQKNYYDSDKEFLDALAQLNDLPVVSGLVGYIDGGLKKDYINLVDNAESAVLYNGEVPSFSDVNKFYEAYFKTIKGMPKEEIDNYNNSVKSFRSRQKNKNSIQALSDLIAYKVYTMDRILYKAYFESLRKYQGSEFGPEAKYQKFLKYYNEFLTNANPEKY